MPREGFDASSSVVDGKLVKCSVSQVKTFDDSKPEGCNRKWYFEKVKHLPVPTFRAQVLGIQLHSQVEHYLGTGENTLGPLARAGQHFLPPPGVGLRLEAPLRKLTAAGVPFRGFIDVENKSGWYIDNEGNHLHEPDIPEVIDWKTTKSIARYAKLAMQLRDDVQMVGYALDIADDDTKSVRLSHGYFQTEGVPVAEKRSILITLDEAREKWERVSATVEEMKTVAGASDVEDVRPNLKACSAYGGCPFRAVCPVPKDQTLVRLETMFGHQKTEGVEAMSLLAKFQQRAASVTPPDAPKSEPPRSAEPIPPEVKPTLPPAIQEAAKAFDAPAATPDPTPAPQPEDTTIANPPTKRRGRPPGSKTKAAPENAVNAAPQTIEQKTADVGIVIYVDCVIDGFDATALDDHVNDAWKALNKEFNDGVDLRLVPQTHALAFGKWKAALETALLAKQPEPGAYYYNGVRGDEVKEAALAAMRRAGAAVVRGAW